MRALYLAYCNIFTLLAKEVTSSCDLVHSPQIGDLSVIKENPRDSRCLDNILQEILKCIM